MHHPIHAGSSEYVLVTIGDRLENVDNIAPLNPAFTIYTENDTVQQASTPADVEVDTPMVAKCLVNTASPTPWPSGLYRLILSLTASPEAVLLNAGTLKVEQI